MKIKNRLYLSAGISIFLVATLLSVVLVTSGRVVEEKRRHELMDNVRVSISELDIITYDYLLHREKRMRHQWKLKYKSLGMILDESAEEEGLKSIQADYVTLNNLFSQITENYDEKQKYIQEGSSQERIDIATQQEERFVAQILITSHSIITDASRIAEETHAEEIEVQQLATNLTLILMIILAIIITFTSLLVARSIAKPLDKLTQGTKIIGKGNLEHRVKIKTKDEIGELAAAFNQMTQNLKATRDDLKKEISVRKQAEENINHLNLILRSVRDVNQLITKEKNRDVLLQEACKILTRDKGYANVWIVLFDEKHKVGFATISGNGEDFQFLINDLKKGKFSYCVKRALDQPEVLLIDDPEFDCSDCPISGKYEGRSAIAVRLQHNEKVYGMLCARIEKEYLTDEEILDLFKEVTDDIAFALYRLELEAANKQAEEVLNKNYQQQKLLIEISYLFSKLGKFDDNLKEAIRLIGEYAGVSRVYIFEDFKNGEYTKNTFEWCNKNIEPQINNLLEIPYSIIPSWKKILDEKGMICSTNISELPKDLTDILEPQKIKSILVLPIHVKNLFFGFMGFDECENHRIWDEREIDLLKTLTNIVSTFLERNQAEETLQESEEKFRNLIETSTDLVFRLTKTGRIVYVSPRVKEQYGYQPDELIGKHLKTTTPVSEIPKAIKALNTVFSGKPLKNFEINQKHRSGQIIPMEINAAPVYKNKKIVGFQGIMRDITERKKAEEQIKTDLEEKNVLLQEIYHRTKNNMQIISSMLKTQSRNLENRIMEENSGIEFLQETFHEIINRIRSMSLVHQKLYQAKDLSHINLKEYIKDLVNLLMVSYNFHSETISLKFELEDVFVLIDSAIPLGLVLNELISNIFKHAFPNKEEGEVCVKLFKDKNETINILLSDNGVGFPSDINLENINTMGLQTAFSLLKYQLKGQIRYDLENGLKWHLKFKDNLHKERV